MSSKKIGDASTRLPLSRIKTIMKSSPNVDSIGPEAIFTVSKCTEIFVQYMSEEGLDRCNNKKILDYKGIAEFVNTDSKLNFLAEILPRKEKETMEEEEEGDLIDLMGFKFRGVADVLAHRIAHITCMSEDVSLTAVNGLSLRLFAQTPVYHFWKMTFRDAKKLLQSPDEDESDSEESSEEGE